MVVHGKENYCKCLQLLLGNKEKIQVNVDVSIAKLLVTFPRKYMFLHKMLFLVENHKKKPNCVLSSKSMAYGYF